MKEEIVHKSHLERNNIIVAVTLSVLAFVLFAGVYGPGVLAGSIISIANIRIWTWAIKRISHHPEQPQGKVYALVGIKFLILIGVFVIFLSQESFHPIALILGFMSFTIAMLFETLKF